VARLAGLHDKEGVQSANGHASDLVRSALALGLIWSIWHYPLWLASSLLTSGSITIALTMVAASTLFTTALSVIVTWIFMRTNGSVLLSMFFHGSSQANLTKMYAAADGSLSDPAFIFCQCATMWCVAFVLVLADRRTSRTAGVPA